jgi:TonB family protein
MQPSDISDRQRTFSNQNLGTILAIGFGGSVLLHLGLIAGITHWWKSPAVIDEPLEITLVEPVANEEIPPAPAPIKLPPQPVSIPKPIALKPIPIPTIPQSIPLAVKPTPIFVKPKPKPIAIKSTPKPIPPTPASKPNQITPKPISNPVPQPIVNPPFPADKFLPIDTPSAPTAFKPPTNSNQPPKKNSAPISVKSTLVEPPSKKIEPSTFNPTPNIPTTRSNLSPPLTQTSRDPTAPKDLPKVGKNLSAGGNNGDTLAEKDRSEDRLTGGILPGNRDRSDKSSSSDSQQSNSIPKSGASSDPAPKTSGDQSSSPATASNSSAGNGRLECVQNCQIPKLQDLQDSDGGKDRLRIRIVIDKNGSVFSAEIAKSSGNRQIDSVVLDGIKQMKFNPMGKIIKGTIKANILL